MIDHLVGRPSPSWKRIQVFVVIFFWFWRISKGHSRPPRLLWLRRVDRFLQRYTPWQIIVSTLTVVYAARNFDKILGLGSPEPLARLYSTSYYRATWINTALEAGFATAMSVRPQWLRNICSIVFSLYYIFYANEADEKLRRFRAVPTVEMLRTTWEKTTNPYIRVLTFLPKILLQRKILLPRPKSSKYSRPITAYIYFHSRESELRHSTDLILDFPGGGFVAMSPEHHEERLRRWAFCTGKPILSIDYGKAPEYPYPFAIDEAYDTYQVLQESSGSLIGMTGGKLRVIISGDSAGASLAVNVVLRILELRESNSLRPCRSSLPLPVSLVLSYAALDFNFTSWMSPANLKVLQSEQSSGNLSGLNELVAQKDHLQHISPLSMVVNNKSDRPSRNLKRKMSWKDTIRGLSIYKEKSLSGPPRKYPSFSNIRTQDRDNLPFQGAPTSDLTDEECTEDGDSDQATEEDRPIRDRVRYSYRRTPSPPILSLKGSTSRGTPDAPICEGSSKSQYEQKRKEPIGTRLTMTSRTGFFQDRIVSPSMMRAMAILYIGPHRNPDFATDYHISPILAPARLLAKFPPLLMQCGEKDPFVDDTVIFAGRIREAKRIRKLELEMAISGKSSRFSNNSTIDVFEEGEDSMECLKNERDRLSRESEDDWVQMVLFSDWSHGYLQMPTLMNEAKAVIEDLALWIMEAFAKDGACKVHDSSVTGNLDRKSRRGLEIDDSVITFASKKAKNSSDVEQGNKSMMADTTHDEVCSSIGEEVSGNPTSHLSLSTPQSSDVPRPGPARQAGTQISETELMRRRRLLDSHIFEK